jgi:ABC-type microcin C transport system permease subunit YejB
LPPNSHKLFFTAVLAVIPISAEAQQIPLSIALGVVSPLFVFILCVVLGILRRSTINALRHIGLMIIWVSLFAIASGFYPVSTDGLKTAENF